MSSIETLIKKKRPNFEVCERQLGEHLLRQYEPEAMGTEADQERIFCQTNQLLISFAEVFFSYGKFKVLYSLNYQLWQISDVAFRRDLVINISGMSNVALKKVKSQAS